VGRRAPRLISDALEPVLTAAAPKTLLAAVQLAWPQAAGPAIDRVASPVSEREGVITVACGSAGWAEQLDLLQDELLAKLRAALGDPEKVRGLRFRLADRPHSPPPS
jgi:predicted nucleic acid-binding Zn ribbon protein